MSQIPYLVEAVVELCWHVVYSYCLSDHHGVDGLGGGAGRFVAVG